VVRGGTVRLIKDHSRYEEREMVKWEFRPSIKHQMVEDQERQDEDLSKGEEEAMLASLL